MPIETDYHVGLGRERYRFRPWYERPRTERQLRACLFACWSVVAVLVVGAGVAVWLAGWPARWLVEPLVVSVLVILTLAGRSPE